MNRVGEGQADVALAAGLRTGEQQRDGEAPAVDDERAAVAAETERLAAAGALDLDLVVEARVAEVVLDHDVVEFERRDPPTGHTGVRPTLRTRTPVSVIGAPNPLMVPIPRRRAGSYAIPDFSDATAQSSRFTPFAFGHSG